MANSTLVGRGLAAGALILLASATAVPAASLVVYDDRAEFEMATGAVAVPVPLAETLVPAFGIPGWGCDEAIAMPFEDNLMTVRAPNSHGDPTLPGIDHAVCVVDDGVADHGFALAPLSPTIVGNGEDDYDLVFDEPVHSIGFELLTNNAAIEGLLFRDDMGEVVFALDVGPATLPESFDFIGFESPTPFVSVFVDTANGAQMNEGISAVLVSETYVACSGSEDPDLDGDGVVASLDCDDTDPGVYPGALDLPGNAIDEDCDGAAVCDACADWNNHGEFVSCVSQTATALVDEGSLSPIDAARIVSSAARTGIGEEDNVPAECGGSALVEGWSAGWRSTRDRRFGLR